MFSGSVVAIMKMIVLRRLLQRLQQGIEGGVSDLVRFVEDVNLVAVAGGRIAGCVAQSRISSMPRFVAASISMTSTAFPCRISMQRVANDCMAQVWAAPR